MERTKITDAGALDIAGNGNYSVVAATDAGNNFVLAHAFESAAAAEATARKVEAAGSIDEDRWVFWRTTYGSAAFEAQQRASSVRIPRPRLFALALARKMILP